jgi:putative membrane protein
MNHLVKMKLPHYLSSTYFKDYHLDNSFFFHKYDYMNKIVIYSEWGIKMKKSLFKAELKSILNNRKLLIPILAVLFIPILYSGMFLWAFWDPYEQLSDLPVAVINNDSGAVLDGEQLQLGQELVDKLKESGQFNFQFVDGEEGYENLNNQDYYMLVEIPESFSQHATTLLDEHPEKLSLKYVPNEGYNFLSAQIGDTAMKEIKASLSESVTETYAETMFESIEKMGQGFADASEAADQLDEGTKKVADGVIRLKENLVVLAEKNLEFTNGVGDAKSGAEQLAAKTAELSDGLDKLSEGYGQLYKGAEKVENGAAETAAGASGLSAGIEEAASGLDEIMSKTGPLNDGAAAVADGTKTLKAGASKASAGASDLNKGINALEGALAPVLQTVPQEQQAQIQAILESLKAGSSDLASGTAGLAGGAEELQTGAASLKGGLDALSKGHVNLRTGLTELETGSDRLASGTQSVSEGQSSLVSQLAEANEKLAGAAGGSRQIAAGEAELQSGLNQLQDGSAKLTEGSNDLADGSKELEQGTSSLRSGTTEFSEEMKGAKEEANEIHLTDETSDMMAGPVDVEKKAINDVPNYGTGFAPYFLSLGLFVGALLISIVYPLKEPALAPSSGVAWFRGKFAVLTLVGVIQSLIADSILLLGLGIEVESIPLFILTTIAASLTFIALVQSLVTILGDPGRFVAIIVLILQLTTSAGTFPLELIPTQLQPISALLPMTYSVAAFKAVISSGDFAFMWQNVGILLFYLIGFALLTVIYFSGYFKKMYNSKTIVPE